MLSVGLVAGIYLGNSSFACLLVFSLPFAYHNRFDLEHSPLHNMANPLQDLDWVAVQVA